MRRAVALAGTTLLFAMPFVTAALADVHEQLDPYYSEIGRPSVDPELMIRMLIIGNC